jgi:hypothetical protein
MLPPPPEEDGPSERIADWTFAGFLVLLGFFVGFGMGFLGLGSDAENWSRSFVIYILCLFAAYLVFQIRRMRRRMLAMEELLADVRFGPGTKRDREAVDILVRALRVSDAGARETALRTLRKLSGFDLGDEPGAWEVWWTASRATFVRMGPAPRPEPAPKK